MADRYDCIVIGAGVSGCSFSLSLAETGYNLLLLESNKFENVGHDWWDAVEESVFSELSISALTPKPNELFKKSPITFYTPRIKKIGATTPSDLNIHRKKYSQRLINLVKDRGIEALDSTEVQKPIFSDSTLTGVKVKSKKDNEIKKYTANLIIDASGMNAVIRTQMPNEFNWNLDHDHGDIMIAYREIRNKINENEREFKTYFGYKNGIFWENHFQEGLVDFFGGIPYKENMADPKKIVMDLIKKNQNAGDKVVMGGYTAKLPIRRCLDSFIDDNLMIIGDAAYQTNPINGCGVASSLIASKIASEVAIKALESGNLSKDQLWEYNLRYIRKRGTAFAALDILKKFLITLSPNDIDYLFERKILKISDIESGYDLKPINIAFFDLLGRVIRGFTRLNLLLQLNRIIKRSNYIRSIYNNYPEKFGDEFFSWQKKANNIFQRDF
ncbi:MAG: hypothetical protein GF329_15165 [Candidatus Lokiarchaeota archaeon]|nr:hypothetical protein [Candidatus Lokiarchaeota archaeon]